MSEWIDTYIAEYSSFLRKKTVCRTDPISGWTIITTPFFGVFNDAIEIFVKKEGEDILLSDDGQTLDKLELCGVSCKPNTKNSKWVDSVLFNHNIERQEDELYCKATAKTFCQKKHDLLCAMLEISEMEMNAQTAIAPSQFKENIRTYFEENRIIYTPQFTIQGETGFDFTFDFQVAGYKEELIIKAFDTINRQNLTTFLFGWTDVRQKRAEISNKQISGLAIINDEDEREIREEFITALQNKSTNYILWSRRAESIAKIKNIAS